MVYYALQYDCMAAMQNPYQVLGISRKSTDSEIKQARRKLLFDLHSDRLPKDLPKGAARLISEKVLEINSAYGEIMQERDLQAKERVDNNNKEASRRNNAQTHTDGTAARKRQNNAEASSKSSEPKETSGKRGVKAVSRIGTIAAQALGAIIGIGLMQACRSMYYAIATKEDFQDQARQITSSKTDYCPELIENASNNNLSGNYLALKSVIEMRKTAPAGTQYRSEVESVIARTIQADQSNPPASLKADFAILSKKYIPIICRGDLQMAILQRSDPVRYASLSDKPDLAILSVANAMCKGLQDNEPVETVTVKMLNTLSEDAKLIVLAETQKNVNNPVWLHRTVNAMVKKCPEYAYRIHESD